MLESCSLDLEVSTLVRAVMCLIFQGKVVERRVKCDTEIVRGVS